MKHKRSRGDAENSENERIIEPPADFMMRNNYDEVDEDEFFENSQELTQIVPRRRNSENNVSVEQSSPKKKTKKQREEWETTAESRWSMNGYHAREMDVSEIPEHIIANMKRVLPSESESSEAGLTVEAVQKAASSSKGGVWIIKCPRDVNLSDLLPGKKLSLDGGETAIDTEEEDSAQLTQFLPTDSLGSNVKSRQFEATSVVNDDYKDGAVLILPDSEKLKLVATPIQGHIIIRECVEELELPTIKTPKCKSRKLPSGIKERHPVYGADFTSIINEMESAPKKKRKKSLEPTASHDYTNGFSKSFPSMIIPKIEIESDDADASHSRKKKKKKHREHDEDVDSETYRHQNGFDNSLTKSLNEDSSSRKTKSKKRKRHELEDVDETVLVDFSEPVPKKLKKSKSKLTLD